MAVPKLHGVVQGAQIILILHWQELASSGPLLVERFGSHRRGPRLDLIAGPCVDLIDRFAAQKHEVAFVLFPAFILLGGPSGASRVIVKLSLKGDDFLEDARLILDIDHGDTVGIIPANLLDQVAARAIIFVIISHLLRQLVFVRRRSAVVIHDLLVLHR